MTFERFLWLYPRSSRGGTWSQPLASTARWHMKIWDHERKTCGIRLHRASIDTDKLPRTGPLSSRSPKMASSSSKLCRRPVRSPEDQDTFELWRRMDHRIHWEDILMRIELPKRTEASERRLQNSTNILIDRHQHRAYSMLAWHTLNK